MITKPLPPILVKQRRRRPVVKLRGRAAEARRALHLSNREEEPPRLVEEFSHLVVAHDTERSRLEGLVALVLALVAAIAPSATTTGLTAARAQSSQLQLVAEIGGESRAVSIQGSHVFLGTGAHVTVLDVSSAATPAVVGESNPLSAPISALTVIGDNVLVVDGSALQLLDARDLTRPRVIGAYAAPPGQVVVGLTALGHFAYLATGSGILAVDFIDASHPKQVGFVDTGGYDPALIAQDEKYVYVVGNPVPRGAAELHVFSVADPAHPTEIGSTSVGFASAMQVREGRVFLGGTNLSIVDASDASHLHVVGSFGPGWETSSITLDGGVLFALESAMFPGRSDQPPWVSGHLHVLDVSDVAHVNETDQIDVGLIGAGSALAALGSTIVLADGRAGGLRVFDVTDTINPTEVGRYNTPGSVGHLDVARSDVYITSAELAGPPKLKILDLADPSRFAVQAEYDIPGVDATVSAIGATAYAGAGFVGGVHILDVSSPIQPAEVGSFKTLGNAYEITIRDRLAYVADGATGLRIFDVSDPANVQELGSYDTPLPKPNGPEAGIAYDVELQDHFAFLAQGWRGLRILDVSDPTNPTEIGALATQGDTRAVAIDGTYVYVVLASGSLDIVDMSDPTAPTLVGSFDLKGPSAALAVADHLVYVPEGGRVQGLQVVNPPGVQVIHVADPAHPVEAAFAATPAAGASIRVDSGLVYVGDRDAGLLVFTALQAP